MKNNNQFTNVIRWTARIVGTAIVALTLLIGIGEMLESYNKHGVSPIDAFDTLTKIYFVIWGVGLAGLILALWKEGLGGIISLVSFIIFNILVATSTNPESSYSYILLVFTIPSILYLYYWWLTKKALSNIS